MCKDASDLRLDYNDYDGARKHSSFPYMECNSNYDPNLPYYYHPNVEVYKFGGNPNYAIDHDSAGNVFLSEYNANSSTQKWKLNEFKTNISFDEKCFGVEGIDKIKRSQYTPGMLSGRKLVLKPCSDVASTTENEDDLGINVSYRDYIYSNGTLRISLVNYLWGYFDYTNCITIDSKDYQNLNNSPLIVGSCTGHSNLENGRSYNIYQNSDSKDNCFNNLVPIVFERETQSKYEIARQGYTCDQYNNKDQENDDLDEFVFGNDNDTLELNESALQADQETDVWKLAMQAKDSTVSQLQKVLEDLDSCGTWDIGCKATNSTFQSSAITMANISGKLLFGALVGAGTSIALETIVKAILSSAFKIVGIFISIIALIAGTIAIFQNLGSILQSYINLPIEDKAFAIGNIIGGLLGVVIFDGSASKALDNISQSIGNISSKASSLTLKSPSALLLLAKQSLSKFGLSVYEKGGKVVVKVNDYLKAIRSGGQAVFDKLKGLLIGSEKYNTIISALGTIAIRDSKIIRYTQSTISKEFSELGGGGLVDDLTNQLISGVKNADTVDPITIFKMDDGVFTSLDNRRLYAFQKANKPIATIERSLDEVLTPELARKYTRSGIQPKTYRDAIDLRIKNQSNLPDGSKYSIKYPNGSFEYPRISNK